MSAKFDESANMPGDDSAKMCCISEKLTSQEKYAVSTKTCRVSRMPVDDSTNDAELMITQQKIAE